MSYEPVNLLIVVPAKKPPRADSFLISKTLLFEWPSKSTARSSAASSRKSLPLPLPIITTKSVAKDRPAAADLLSLITTLLRYYVCICHLEISRTVMNLWIFLSCNFHRNYMKNLNFWIAISILGYSIYCDIPSNNLLYNLRAYVRHSKKTPPINSEWKVRISISIRLPALSYVILIALIMSLPSPLLARLPLATDHIICHIYSRSQS